MSQDSTKEGSLTGDPGLFGDAASGAPEQQQSIARLIGEFEARTLPKERWTHEAHVLVALGYVVADRDPLERMRSGIQALNAAHGVPTTLERGYHETLTCFYVAILMRYVQEQEERAKRRLSVEDLAPGALRHASRELPLSYYSRELLFSAAARFGRVDPDLRPLDS